MKLELVGKEMELRGKLTGTLSCCFREFKRALGSFVEQVRGLTEQFLREISDESYCAVPTSCCFAFAEHLKNMISVYGSMGTTIEKEILEPLEIFSSFFRNSNRTLISEIQELSLKVLSSKENMGKSQAGYYSVARSTERILSKLQSAVSTNKKTKQIAVHKEATFTAFSKYITALNESNELCSELDRRAPVVLDQLAKNEENRVHFIKKSLDRFLACTGRLGANADWGFPEEALGYLFDLEDFQSPNKEELLSFGEWKESQSFSHIRIFGDFELSTHKGVKDSQTPMICTVLEKLVNNNQNVPQLEVDEALEGLNKVLQSSKGRLKFIELLEARKPKSRLLDKNVAPLVQVLRTLLSSLQSENCFNSFVFGKTIVLANVFYVQRERKLYIASYLKSHPI